MSIRELRYRSYISRITASDYKYFVAKFNLALYLMASFVIAALNAIEDIYDREFNFRKS
jgi:hypothetical protein